MTETALITGSEGGIGQALCQQFRAAGFKVIGLDLEPRSAPHDVFVPCDLLQLCQNDAYRADILAELHRHCAENQLKVLINNAAVQILKTTEEIHIDDWHQTMNVNVIAPFLLTQGLLADLEAGAGSVINIASVHAQATKPGFVCYATSKAALVGLTKAMAVDLGPRVRVNAICPAATATPMLRAGFGPRWTFSRRVHSHGITCILSERSLRLCLRRRIEFSRARQPKPDSGWLPFTAG